MGGYLALKHLHGLLVATSLTLFVWRAVAALRDIDWRARWPALRHLPHAVDTLLLAAGISLALWSRQLPHTHPWLALKLALLVAYILAGVQALRRSQTRARRGAWVAAALLAAAWMVGIGLTRQMLPGAG